MTWAGILLGTAGLLLLQRPLYLVFLKMYGSILFKQKGKKPENLVFSFEEMTYFVTLPNRSPYVENAPSQSYRSRTSWSGALSPSINAVFISICEKEEVRVAMMTHSRFKVPALERMRFDGDVSDREFDMMKSCMLINRHTRSAFKTEVYRRIHQEDFIDTNNGKEG